MDISNDAKLKKLAQKQVSTDAADSTSDLLNWNNLEYTMPVTSSVASSRNVKEYPAERTTYSQSQNVTFVVQTASQYVDWSQSILSFDAEFKLKIAQADKADFLGEIIAFEDAGENATQSEGNFGKSAGGVDVNRERPLFDILHDKVVAHFGAGSACNFIDQVVVQSRSGVEIYRIEAFDKYRVMQDRCTEPEEFYDREGSLMGYSKGTTFTGKEFPTDIDSEKVITQATPFLVDNELNAFVLPIGSSTTIPSTGSEFTLKKKFVIPLNKLGGIFATNQLCPAVMASGLRVTLTLKREMHQVLGGVGIICRPEILGTREVTSINGNALEYNLQRAHYYGTEREYVPIGGYIKKSGRWCHYNSQPLQVTPRFSVSEMSGNFELTNLKLHIDTTLLVDSATHQLSQVAASKGLTITFDQCFHQRFDYGASSEVNGVMSKAVSRAIMATGGLYALSDAYPAIDQNQGGIPRYAADLVIPLPLLSRYRFRLGSEYYPQQHITDMPTAYWSLLRAFGQLDMKSSKSRLQKVDFLTWGQWFSATFERSAILKYSGQPINNSRTLSFEAKFLTDSSNEEDHRITRNVESSLSKSDVHVWLEYMSVAQTFINNAIVKI